MSAQSMSSFLQFLADDHDQARGLKAAVGSLEGVAAETAVAEYARTCGFAVDVADVGEFRATCLAWIEKDGDLSEAELEQVGGGFVMEAMGIALLAGFGAMTVVTFVGPPVLGTAAVVGTLAQNGGDNPVVNWFKQW